MSKKIRVRFAPSPTGYLHIGGLRTALFNYLFAKKNEGTFILRIEDTDRARYVAEAEDYILKSLNYCGLGLDESSVDGGEYGPYKQSERKDLYTERIKELIANGSAYYAFDSSEEIETMRNQVEHFQYGHSTRMQMKNSLTFSEEETKNWIEAEKPYTIRFKMPENKDIAFTDLVRGEVKFNTSNLDDKILLKGDGMPTYHLANICDDHAMKISHVIRGEEWLSSTTLHVLLYEAFGWHTPEFAHLPLILNPSGPGKLSKRAGKKFGFPVFPLEWKDDESNSVQPGFKEIGFIPEAFNNMLAFLGWNPGNDQEIFTMDELIKNFDLSKVQKAGARFDWEKAKWFNQQFLQNQDEAEIAKNIKSILTKYASTEDSRLEKAVALVKERMTFYPDFEDNAAFLFEAPIDYDEKNVRKRFKPVNEIHFKNLLFEFEGINNWNEAEIENTLKSYLSNNDLGFGAILPGFRIMLTGKMGGPSVFEIAEFIGKEETKNRIQVGIEKFKAILDAAQS